MNLLFRILRATHARGTHHKLALDALHRLQLPEAETWERLFLKHADLYMAGAKAPDDEFKDFQNHVLHPRDKYWGGAPEKVASWYGHMVAALKAENWTEAVWCAGVMSHYATDPVHPFHTAQSEAENNIHRAAEWSINRSYDGLWSEAIAAHADLDVAIPVGPHWIKDMVCAAADRSNADYEKLIAHYDINRGVVDPPEGLDSIAQALVGELLVYAATLQARLLERAIAEAGVAPPGVTLTLDTILATLAIPVKALLKKLGDAGDRRIVEAMYDELRATGRVEANLPEDDRMVRDLHAAEILAPRASRLADARTARLPVSPAFAAVSTLKAARSAVKPKIPAAAVKGGRSIAADVPPNVAAASAPSSTADAPPDVGVPLTPVPEPAHARETRAKGAENVSVPQVARPAPPSPDATVAIMPPPPRQSNPAQGAAAPEPLARLKPRFAATDRNPGSAARAPTGKLVAGDDLEAAPSIGPKTAERFALAGIRTVAEFLAADPDATVAKLGARHITAEVIVEWQDQARLVMAIPGLRGGHAQLLTGAGFRTVTEIATAAPDVLCSKILSFAVAPEGQRILRDGNPPDVEKIKSWIDGAAHALAA
ncbi:MAG: hypothetical protein CTY20_06095 [Hyphomicrobium sp.]|nr:MAG: hypothetical protein CTY20_06095 [Hyphomicrobium sp.]